VGAPGQDPRDSVADLVYLAGKTAIAGVSVFYPAPGSADFEKCGAQNLLPAALSQLRSTALPISGTTTRKDSITLLRLARILNFFKSLDSADKQEVLDFAKKHAAQAVPAQIATPKAPYGVETHAARRRAIGKTLLGIFLRDGVIYGVSPEGHLFQHRTSDALCLEFRSGLLGLFS
jgi:hypothetical protein